MRLTVLLVRPVVKATALVPFLPAAVIALTMGWVASRQPAAVGFRFTPVRTGVLALAIACLYLFDDPASIITDPTPSRLRTRRLLRVGVGVVLTAVALTGLVLLASREMDLVWTVPAVDAEEAALPGGLENFPAGRVALETFLLVSVGLATAALVAARGVEEPGRIATSVLLGAYLLTWMVPERIRIWAQPFDERWPTVGRWILGAALISSAVLIVLSWEARHRVVARFLRNQRRRMARSEGR